MVRFDISELHKQIYTTIPPSRHHHMLFKKLVTKMVKVDNFELLRNGYTANARLLIYNIDINRQKIHNILSTLNQYFKSK
jgi:hypothetical protein